MNRLPAILCVIVAMLASAGTAAAAVTVIPADGAQRTISDAQISELADVNGASYAVRNENGQTSSQSVTGLSLPKLLSTVGIDSLSYRYVELERPGGGNLLLNRQQASDGSVFPDGPPVFYLDGQGNTVFLRPSSGSSDSNASDWITSPNVVVNLRKGELLQVSAVASPRKAKAKQSIDFKAELEQAAAGEQVTYSWYFDDGSSAKGEQVAHSFKRRGSYDVVVTVTTPNDDVGASAVVNVKIGAQSTNGPNRRGGGTDSSAFAPDSGAATGQQGRGASSLRVDSSDDAQQAPKPQPKPKPEPEDKQVLTDPEQTVEGAVLADANGNPLPPRATIGATAGVLAARTGTEKVSGGLDVPPEVWMLLGTLSLILAGAVLERTGWLRRRSWR